VGLAAGATWLAAAFLSRMSSAGALTAALLAPLYALLLGRPVTAGLAAFMGVLIYLRHKENIRRMLKGEEPRIGKNKAPPPWHAPSPPANGAIG
jgi:glycerol-3-phosphate acyltransferase PlsY